MFGLNETYHLLLGDGFPRPHDEIWYEDGNVLLIADAVSFRVHRSILARHSEFFNDMFKLPQPPQNDTGSDDAQCPVVHTSESAEDLGHFLGAIYDSVKSVLCYHVKSLFICFFPYPHYIVLPERPRLGGKLDSDAPL